MNHRWRRALHAISTSALLLCGICHMALGESLRPQVIARGEAPFVVPSETKYIGSILINVTDAENWTARLLAWDVTFLSVVRVEVTAGREAQVVHVPFKSSQDEMDLIEQGISDTYPSRSEGMENPYLALLTFPPGEQSPTIVVSPRAGEASEIIRLTLNIASDPPVATASTIPQVSRRVFAFNILGDRTAVLFEQHPRTTTAIMVIRGNEIVQDPTTLHRDDHGRWNDVAWLDNSRLALIGEVEPPDGIDRREMTGSMRLGTATFAPVDGQLDEAVHLDLSIQINGSPAIIGPLTPHLFHVLVDLDPDLERVEFAIVRVEENQTAVVARFEGFSRMPLWGNPGATTWVMDEQETVHFLHVPMEAGGSRLIVGSWKPGSAEPQPLPLLELRPESIVSATAGFGLVPGGGVIVAWVEEGWMEDSRLCWALVADAGARDVSESLDD